MNQRQLEAFHAVMVTGSVTAAAERLHLSQPAVSRLIADLERSVAFRLFERVKGSPLSATPEAESFHLEVERSFHGLNSLGRVANDIRSARTGNLRIASLPALATAFLPEIVRDFLADSPGVRVNLQSRSSTTVRQWVAAQQVDFGLATPSDNTSGLRVEGFLSLPGVCMLPPAHRLRRKDVISPEDLQGESFISLSNEDPARQQIDRIFQDARVERDVRIETQYAMTIGSFVMRGAGCSILNPVNASEFVAHGVHVRPFQAKVRFEYVLCMPEHRLPTRIAANFLELLRSARDRLQETYAEDPLPASRVKSRVRDGMRSMKRVRHTNEARSTKPSPEA